MTGETKEWPLGRCHLCQNEEPEPIAFCALCDHWFCDDCRKRWAARGIAAVKQVITGKWPGCCGPEPRPGSITDVPGTPPLHLRLLSWLGLRHE